MHLVVGPAMANTDPALDVAIAHTLLRRASEGELGPTVRISRPVARTVAFGRTDTRRSGFAEAVRLSRLLGFAPIVRGTGGRAAAYTEAAVVIDHVSPDPEPGAGMRQRFRDYGDLLADVLCGLGVDARVGEVPEEYCPGEYSVNARGAVKLVGTAQRVVRGAWWFSAVVVVGGGPELRALLPVVHQRLELPFQPASVGSVSEEAPGVGVAEVERAFVGAFVRAVDGDLRLADIGSVTLSRSRSLLRDHTIG